MNSDYEILCLMDEKWETFSRELSALNASLQDFELSDCLNRLNDVRADELAPALKTAADIITEHPSEAFRDVCWHYGRI